MFATVRAAAAACSQAARIGLKDNDVILELEEKVADVRDFLKKFSQRRRADCVITIWPNQSEKKLVVRGR